MALPLTMAAHSMATTPTNKLFNFAKVEDPYEYISMIMMHPSLDARIIVDRTLRKLYYDPETRSWCVREKMWNTEKYCRVSEHGVILPALRALTLEDV